MTEPAATETPETPRPPRRLPLWATWAIGVVAGLLALVLVTAAVVRYGAVTPPGRALIVQLLNGQKVGPAGRLRLSGLKGDVFGAFALDSLEIVDAKGPWISVRHLSMVWNPGELFARRLHIGRLAAERVQIHRQPELIKEPPRPPSQQPVSVVLDDLTTTLETDPAFSVQRGLWSTKAKLILRRNGHARVDLRAQSLLHVGDGLEVALQIADRGVMHLRAYGIEAAGGGLAGALGLAADRRLVLHAQGDSTGERGTLQARIASGATHPLDFDGRWSKGGADIKGHVDLAASNITRYFAERLGSEADVVLSVKPKPGATLYVAQGRLTAPQGRLTVDGPVDWKARKAEGVAIDLSLADLSKWLGFPKIGPTTLQGTFSGGIDDFLIKGRLGGERLDQDGVKVARLTGPTTIARQNHEWRLQTDLQGAGATAPSPIGPLLGAAPRVAIDLQVLKDGRFLIRSLDLKGAGAVVKGEGGSGLLGGLTFKGDLAVSNLNPIHPGAHGAVTASWTASEAKGAHAWQIAFDAKGSSFATGLPELDRYLGAQPHLVAEGAYGEGKLTVNKADLAGGALTASVKGVLGEHENLDFDGTWTAKGPFAAGPVEIAGTAKGTGKVIGSLSNPRADLVADLASLDFGRLVITPAKLTLSLLKGPDGLDGAADLEGQSTQYGHASLKTAFRFVEGGIALDDLVADAGGVKLSGAVALRNGAPSTADLTVAAGPGAFLSAGRLTGSAKLTDGPGGQTARVSLDGQGVASPDLPVVLRSVHLTAAGPLAHLPFQASVDGVDPLVWSFKGSGVYAGGKETELTLNGGGMVRRAKYTTTTPATLRFGPQGNSAKLDLAIAGGRAVIDARDVGGAIDAKADLTRVELAPMFEDFTGQVSGTLALKGKGADLGGSMAVTLDGARSRDEPANEALAAKINATLAGSRIHLVASGSNPQGLEANLDVDLPAEASAAPFRIAIDRRKPLHGQFSADGEVRPLWDLIAGGERTLSGHFTAKATLGGSMGDPAATGQAALTQGKFRDVATGLALQNLTLNAAFDQTVVTVSRFAGADSRGGSLTGEGRVSLDRGGGSTFTLTAKRFQLIDNDIGRASASGAVTVTRDAQGKARLAGALTIDRADFAANTPVPTGVVPMEVVELHAPVKEGVERPKPGAAGPVVTLDVALRAGRGIFLRGKGLDAELSLDAHVGGTTDTPDLSGTARVVRGFYDFAGQRFDIDERSTVRLGSAADQIRLDLTATRADPTLTAVVRVKGTAAKPEVTLSSTPVLPQEEVLARVLFGVSAAQLSPAQSAQLASALASLVGGGGFDLIGNLRQFAGLDRLALGGSQASGTTVSGGKYLTDNVYLELTGGGRTGPTAQVEWRVRRDLSLVSMVGAQGDARLSVRFRKDY